MSLLGSDSEIPAIEFGHPPESPMELALELEAVALDTSQTRGRRHQAAISLTLLRSEVQRNPEDAKDALALVQSLSPKSKISADEADAAIRVALLNRDVEQAREISAAAIVEFADDARFWLTSAAIQRLAQTPGATVQAARAVELAQKPSEKAEALYELAHAHYVACSPSSALEHAKQSFQASPNRKAAQLLGNFTLPDFASRDRPKVEALLGKAKEAYQRGDHARVQDLALRIIGIDDDEALAYHLYGLAELRALDGRPLIPDLDSPAKRETLIARLERAFSAEGLAVDSLFVDWAELNQTQRASVAHSVLPFAQLIPDIAGRKPAMRYRLVSPADSCVDSDPDTERSAKVDAFGRHWYGTRGWVGRRTILTGLEDVELAARGSYDTVAHEFAHLVHKALERRPYDQLPDSIRAFAARVGIAQPNVFDDIVAQLFSRATSPHHDAQPISHNAGTMLQEYFADSMMASLNDVSPIEQNKARLGQLDPEMAELAGLLVSEFGRDFKKM